MQEREPYQAVLAPVVLTTAAIQGRVVAHELAETVAQIPRACCREEAYLVVTGPSFGTRESRYVDCAYQLKEADVLAGARFGDSIALGALGNGMA